MAYAFSRIGHQAANQWETWNITSPTGVGFVGAIVRGRVSGATAIIVDQFFSFAFAWAQVTIIRYNGTAFTNGETCDVYTVSGGASVGTFALAAGGASSTATHPVVVVTGSDTANLFEAVYGASVAGGWGYHSTSNTRAQLDCSIMVGDPFQGAVCSAVSKNESLTHNGNLWIVGNSTYGTDFVMGEGTYGDVGSVKNGCVIVNSEVAPVFWYGSGRYGYWQVFDCYISTVYSGWKGDFTRVTTNLEPASTFGSLDFETFPVAAVGKDGTDVSRLYGCVAGCGMILSHGNLEFTNVDIGDNAANGIVFFGGGDLTAQNLIILNSAGVTDIYGFLAGGTKTFIDCTVDETDIDGFWSNFITTHKYTLSAVAETPDGDPVENVQMRMWNDDGNILSDAPDFNITSNASGEFTDQEVTYCTSGTPGYDNLQPMTFFVNLAGFREKLFDYTFTKKTEITLTMENVMGDFR